MSYIVCISSISEHRQPRRSYQYLIGILHAYHGLANHHEFARFLSVYRLRWHCGEVIRCCSTLLIINPSITEEEIYVGHGVIIRHAPGSPAKELIGILFTYYFRVLKLKILQRRQSVTIYRLVNAMLGGTAPVTINRAGLIMDDIVNSPPR